MSLSALLPGDGLPAMPPAVLPALLFGATSITVSLLSVLRKQAREQRVIIADREVFERKRRALVSGGMCSLQVVADFDRTLTSCFCDGKRGASCHGIIESCSTLSAKYRRDASVLFSKYHPIEIDPHRTREQKIPLMKEWYKANHDILVTEPFYMSDIVRAVAHARVQLRPGTVPLLHTLAKYEVPVLIFSAGIKDVLEEVLAQKYGTLAPNVHVISNRMTWDEHGRISGFVPPLIHMFNKDESHLKGTAWFGEAAGRRNVLLMGDSLGDVTMADGCEHDEVLRIGFLNEDSKAGLLLPQYLRAYDVVIMHDGPMDFALDLVRDIVHADAGGGGGGGAAR